MITIKEQSTIASISELKTKSEEIIKQLAEHQVILQKHNKPVAVMVAYGKFQEFEKLIDSLEDKVLGLMALERFNHTDKNKYLPLEDW